MKRRCVLLFLLNFAVSPAFAEDVTLTTYYPAPYGEYKELTTTGKTLLATDGTSNVGIGTTAPTHLLHAVTGTSANLGIESTSGGGSVGLMAKNADRAWFAQVRGDLNDAFAISDVTAAQYRLLIDRFGNVGIGTTTPTYKLHVFDSTDSVIALGRNDNPSAFSIWRYSTGAVEFGPLAHDGLMFLTDNIARMYIDPEGRVGIGAYGNPGGTLDVYYGSDRRFLLQDDGNAVIYHRPTGATLWNSGTGASSVRWKQDIRPIENALDKVAKLRGVSFNWKDGHVNSLNQGRKSLGLIAEELGKVFPELVSYEKDGNGNAVALEYEKLTAVLVEAVKELKTRNETLERKVLDLEKLLKNPRRAEKRGDAG